MMAKKKDTSAALGPDDIADLNRQMGLLKLSIEGLQAKADHSQIEPEDIHPIWDLVGRIREVTERLEGGEVTHG
jgi:hypothetical protein